MRGVYSGSLHLGNRIHEAAGRSEAQLRFLEFDSGKDSPIARIRAVVTGGLSVTQDQETILYSQRDAIGSDLVLMEGFR